MKPASYQNWVTIAQLVAQIGFFTTTVFCGILIFLTVFGGQKNFGSYKNLLVLFSTVGIFFSVVELTLYPNVHSFNAGYFFYSTQRPFGLEIEIVQVLMAFYTSIYASTICMLAVQFVYRYWAIFNESLLHYFKGWRFLFSIAYSFIVGAQWGLSIYFFDEMDDYTDNYSAGQKDIHF